MSQDNFVCRFCDQSFSSQELLIDHNQIHVKNEPGLFKQGTDRPNETTTSCSLVKSLINVKQKYATLFYLTDLAMSSYSNDTLSQNIQNAAKAASSTSNGISTSVSVHESTTDLKRECNSPKIEALDLDEVLVQAHESSTDMKQEFNSPKIEAMDSDENVDQILESSTDLKQESNSPKIEALDSDEILIQRLSNVHNEVKQSQSILWKGKCLLICNKCGRKCLHEEHLAEHYRQHIVREKQMYYYTYGSYIETQPPDRCDLCNLSFKGNSERKQHFNQIHKYTVGFCNCEQKFFKHKHLLKHARLFHPEKLVKCDVCYRGFVRNKDLDRHYKIHKLENSREWFGMESKTWLHSKLKCDVCPKVFVRAKDLKAHYKSHRGEDSREWFADQKGHVLLELSNIKRARKS